MSRAYIIVVLRTRNSGMRGRELLVMDDRDDEATLILTLPYLFLILAQIQNVKRINYFTVF